MELRFKISLLNLIWMILIACLVIVPVAIAGEEDEEDAPVSATSDPLPNNMLKTGSLSKQIPITVPPGRNGLAPKISLQYSSSNKKNEGIGVGWSINIDFIQRSAKRGVDYGANDFVFKGNELVPVSVDESTGSGEYCLKIESDFTKFNYNPGSGWTALLKDGTKHYFGLMSSSRADNTHGVFMWYLCKVEDSNGNFAVYEYDKDAQYGSIYPLKISYTHNGAIEASNRVEFIREGRTDIIPSYTTHTKVTTAERLKYIKAYANDQLVNQYVLHYDYGENSDRSRLIRIQLFGTDGTTALPATVFEYTQGGNGNFIAQNSLKISDKRLKARAFCDFDGDGYTDIVLSGTSSNDGSGRKVWVSYSKGDGSFYPPTLIFDGYYYIGQCSMYPLAGDVNGDGKCDIVMVWIKMLETVEYYDFYPTYQTYLSNSDRSFDISEFHDFTTQGTPMVWSEANDGQVYLSDINGDGLSDLHLLDINYLSNGNGSFTERQQSYTIRQRTISVTDVTGDGCADLIALHYTSVSDPFEIQSILIYPGKQDGSFAEAIETPVTDWIVELSCMNLGNICSHMYALILDINGDGLADIFHRGTGNIYYSNGDGTFDGPKTSSMAGRTFTYMSSGDINGDGYDDIIGNNHPLKNATQVYIFLSKGNGSFKEEIIFQPAALWYTALVDVNGDGRADLNTGSRDEYASSSTIYTFIGNYYTYLSNGDNPPDLLSQINNGTGYKASISYSNSSQYENKCLPFIVHPVESITETDGVSSSHTTEYNYADGYYNFKDREFRGFGTVVESLPNESTKTIFHHLDAYRKGNVYQIDHTDTASGNLLSRSNYTWEAVEDAAAPWAFVKLSRIRTEYYDDQTVFSQTDYTYNDANGNLMTLTRSGTGANDIVIQYDYVNYSGDDSNPLWRKTLEKTYDTDSPDLPDRHIEYVHYAATGNLQQKIEVNHDPGVDNSVWKYDYYPNGNLRYEYDANGNPPTEYAQYDNTQTYPTKIINPAGHEINKTWDPRYGKELTITDPNQQTTAFAYDEFGRLEQTDYPDGGQTIQTYHDYCTDAGCTNVALPRRIDVDVKTTDTTFENTVDYFDGLTRKVQTVKSGEGANFIVTKTHYDNMGRVDFQSGPFFQQDPSFLAWNGYTHQGYATHPGFDYPYVHTAFDKRDRPEIVTSRDGQNGLTDTSYAYSGFAVTITDPDKCARTEIHDHLERIVDVIDHPDTGDIHTRYVYNAADDLLEVRNHFWTAGAPDENRALMKYDSLGRKTHMHDPDMGQWDYRYDANGNMVLQTDAKGNRIQFDYDEFNRIKLKDYLDTAEPSVTYQYDQAVNGIGRLYRQSNSDVTTVYQAYDEMGRATKMSKTITGTATRATLWDYDYSGKIKRLTYPHTDASPLFHVDYAFHPGTRLVYTVTGSDGTVYATVTDYEPSAKIGRIDFGNGAYADFGYDGWSGRLNTIKTIAAEGAVAQDRQYTYSPAGDITSIDDLAKVETYFYGYDKMHRLTSETTSTGSAGVIPAIMEMQYDDPNHIHAVSSVIHKNVSHAYAYDENGNQESGPDLTDPMAVVNRNLTFNADNMPATVAHSKGGTISLIYDGKGKRAKKSGPNGNNYYFEKEFQIRNGTEAAYIFAGNLRVAKVKPGSMETFYFHKDHLGSSTVMTRPDGTIHETTQYMPYGGKRGDLEIAESDYQFTDQERDKETGLYNYDARLYDPAIGRFISADGIVPDWYDSQALDRYAYTSNNPLKYNDPDGNIPVETVADVISIGISAYSLITQPSWANLGFLAWDVAATIAPYVPGSYAGKTVKAGSKVFKGVSEAGQQTARYADNAVGFVDDAGSAMKNALDAPPKKGLKNADDVIHVTPDGVALPKGTKIPDHYVENPHGRPGSYGEMVDGKFQEKLRIDPATPAGKKGPNYSHYHKDGKRPHYSPRPGDKDPGF